MQSMADTGLDLTSSLSESASAIAGFAQQVSNASRQLEKLARVNYSTRAQVLLITGIFTGAATAIYKFVKSTAEAEMGLAKLAKQQKKTVETARASQTALESMGKTLKEVKSDKELKKTYDELVKINAEMALPKMDRAIENVKGLRNAFWQLRDTAKYAIDWIGARVLINLEEPIKRITGKFSEVAKWLRFNLDSVTMKISSGITAFVKGIEGLVEGFGKVIDLISQIDPNIRKIGGAILFVLGLLKSGPIGQILAVLTAIGGIIDDAENYKYNQHYGLTKENRTGVDEKGRPIQYVDTAFTGIWDIMFGKEGEGKTGSEKITAALEKAFSGVTEHLKNLSESIKGIDLWGSALGDTSAIGETIDGVKAWLKGEGKEKIIDLGKSIFDVLKESLKAGGDLISDAAGLIVSMFTGIEDSDIEAALADNNVSTGIGSAMLLKLFGVSDFGAVIGGIFAGIDSARDDAMKALPEGASDDQINQKMVEMLGLDFTNLGSLILQGIRSAIGAVGEAGSFASDVLNMLLGDGTVNLETEGQNATFFAGFGTSVGTFFSTLAKKGDFITAAKDAAGTGFLTSIVTAVLDATDTDKSNGQIFIDWSKVGIDLKASGESFVNIISTMLKGVKDVGKTIFSALGEAMVPQGADAKTTLTSLFGDMFAALGSSDILGGSLISGITTWLGTGSFGLGLIGAIGDMIVSAGSDPEGINKLKNDFDKFWNGWTEVLDAPGSNVDKYTKKHKGFLDNILDLVLGPETEMEDGTKQRLGGIVEVFANLWQSIEPVLKPLGEQMLSFFDQTFARIEELAKSFGAKIWEGLFEALPQWAKDFIGYKNMGGTKAVENGEGEPNIWNGRQEVGSTNGNSAFVSQEDLKNFPGIFEHIEIGDDGQPRLTGELANDWVAIQFAERIFNRDRSGDTSYLDWTSYNELADRFGLWERLQNSPSSGGMLTGSNAEDSKAQEKAEDYYGERNPNGITLATVEGEKESANIEADNEEALNAIEEVKNAYEELQSNLEENPLEIDGDPDKLLEKAGEAYESIGSMKPKMIIEGDAGPAISEAQSAVSKINSMTATISVSAAVSLPDVGGGKVSGAGGFFSKFRQAWGGRVGREMNNVTVGEDGTEYIIPITKPSRAAELIKQMFGEMGTSSVQKIVEDLGLGMSGNTIGSDYASIASAMGGSSNITTNNNVSAPVNIYVSASGVGAEDVGARAYDAAQRQHLRMLKGVFA